MASYVVWLNLAGSEELVKRAEDLGSDSERPFVAFGDGKRIL